jgi:hypothetical protein
MSEVATVAAIHDCVGGRAPEMGVMSLAVRTGFAKFYQGLDPLTELYEAAREHIDEAERYRLAPPQAAGAMDVGDVLGAEYFFS